MTMTDEKAPSGGAGREAIEALVASGGLDGLFEQINSGQVALTGSDGLLPALLKETLERGLQAELTDHLGYEKGQRAPAARGNARNGASTKTMDSEVGPFEIEVPRDRAGTFTPRLVRKGQRRMDGLDAMIISLYAGGMTVREIRHHLESTLGVGLSAGTISNITDAVCDAVMEWQQRPPGGVLPGDLPRRDPRQGPRPGAGVQQGGPHRRRCRYGGRLARPGDLGAGRRGRLLEGRRVCAQLGAAGSRTCSS